MILNTGEAHCEDGKHSVPKVDFATAGVRTCTFYFALLLSTLSRTVLDDSQRSLEH